MFIGHYAVAMGVKRVAPKVSLGTMILSVQFPDLLWPILLLFGVEHVRVEPGITAYSPLDLYDYPWSHSLLTDVVWSIGLGFAYRILRGDARGAWAVALGVFSHWILDFATHRPDMPLSPWSGMLVGLGLWNSVGATIMVEGLLFLAGVFIYARSTRSADLAGSFGFWSLVVFLAGAWTSTLFLPPPPGQRELAVGGLLFSLTVPWGYWIDRHRRPRGENPARGVQP